MNPPPPAGGTPPPGAPPPGGYGGPPGPPAGGFGGHPPPGGYGGPPPAPGGGHGGYAPAPKKSGSGCLKGCLIAGAVGLVLCLVGGFIAYRAIMANPEVRRGLDAVGDTYEIFEDATGAKGTDELRDEGCEDPMVFDIDKLFDLMEKLDDRNEFERPDTHVEKLIVCNARRDLACDDVAAAYVDAASPDDAFAVAVNDDRGKNVCSVRYDEKGKPQGDFENIELPKTPK